MDQASGEEAVSVPSHKGTTTISQTAAQRRTLTVITQAATRSPITSRAASFRIQPYSTWCSNLNSSHSTTQPTEA